MRVLIAEDDLMSRRVLEVSLKSWGYDVLAAEDGEAAWAILQQPTAPRIALLDWAMPGLDGVEVCRRARALSGGEATYLLLLTARDRKEDIVLGLEGGANDYLVKPFHRDELRARVRTGAKMVELHQQLAQRLRDLEAAASRVKQLQGLLPICCYCKSIRDAQNYWQEVEAYVTAHTDASFSHSICPSCWQNVVKPEAARAGIQIP